MSKKKKKKAVYIFVELIQRREKGEMLKMNVQLKN